MTITPEHALEMALATNLNYLLLKQLQKSALTLIVLQEKLGGPDPLTDEIAKNIVKMRDEVGVLMDRYNEELGKVADENPELAKAVQAQVKGHDIITALELNVRMSAQDRLTQLMMRGK